MSGAPSREAENSGQEPDCVPVYRCVSVRGGTAPGAWRGRLREGRAECAALRRSAGEELDNWGLRCRGGRRPGVSLFCIGVGRAAAGYGLRGVYFRPPHPGFYPTVIPVLRPDSETPSSHTSGFFSYLPCPARASPPGFCSLRHPDLRMPRPVSLQRRPSYPRDTRRITHHLPSCAPRPGSPVLGLPALARMKFSLCSLPLTSEYQQLRPLLCFWFNLGKPVFSQLW